MKKQIRVSQGTVIAISLLAMLLAMTARNEKKGAIQRGNVSPAKVEMNSAIITNKTEDLKRYVTPGSTLDEKEPLEDSGPLDCDCLFSNLVGVFGKLIQ